MHLEIPQVLFASCAMHSIGQLPMTSKGNRFVLTLIWLITSYLITVPLKTKTVDEVSMAYIKEILPKTSCSKFISKLRFLVYSVLEPTVGYLTTLHFNSQQGTHPTLVWAITLRCWDRSCLHPTQGQHL